MKLHWAPVLSDHVGALTWAQPVHEGTQHRMKAATARKHQLAGAAAAPPPPKPLPCCSRRPVLLAYRTRLRTWHFTVSCFTPACIRRGGDVPRQWGQQVMRFGVALRVEVLQSNLRLCWMLNGAGENMTAVHSIEYEQLPAHFFLFAVLDTRSQVGTS